MASGGSTTCTQTLLKSELLLVCHMLLSPRKSQIYHASKLLHLFSEYPACEIRFFSLLFHMRLIYNLTLLVYIIYVWYTRNQIRSGDLCGNSWNNHPNRIMAPVDNTFLFPCHEHTTHHPSLRFRLPSGGRNPLQRVMLVYAMEILSLHWRNISVDIWIGHNLTDVPLKRCIVIWEKSLSHYKVLQ
jgi:hypothetical protein